MKKDELTIDVKGLRKVFGDFVAVDRVDLSIKKGEIYGFLGPNGAGKSTTIKMLCGILYPTSGSGFVAGFDLLEEPERVKSHIGYMSQRFSLYEELTVEENIDFFLGIYNVPKRRRKERKEWVLEMAELKERRRAITKNLPTGFRQRLALGCAIVHEPPVIFLDEPTSGTDPIMRRRFWSLINDLAFQGKTLFVTTHYLDEAEYCNRIGLIYKGRIIAEGPPSKLKQNFKEFEVLEIEVENPFETLKILSEGGIKAFLFGRNIHANLEDKEKLVSILKERGFEIKRMEVISPSLEDVFIGLIRAEE